MIFHDITQCRLSNSSDFQSDINKEIRKENRDTKIVTNNIKELKNKYKELISEIRNAAIKAIDKERQISN